MTLRKSFPFVLFAAAWAYLAVDCRLGITFYDEGAFSYEAWRILCGEIPYRDFMIIYTPGSIYALAGLFKIFGISLMVERIYQTAVWSWMLVTVFQIVHDETGDLWLSLLAWVFPLLWLGLLTHVAGGAPMALALSMASCRACLRIRQKSSNRHILMAGIFAGLAFLFRQDIGLYTMIVCVLTLLSQRSLRPVLKYKAAFLLPVLPAALYFLSRVPLATLGFDLVQYPLAIYPSTGWLPYPWNAGFQAPLQPPLMVFALAPLGIVLSTILLLVELLKNGLRSLESRCTRGTVLFTLLGIFLLKQVLFRADAAHLPYVLIPGTILFCLWSKQLRWLVKHRLTKIALVCLLIVILFPFVNTKLASVLAKPSFIFDLPRGRGIAATAGAEELSALNDYQRTILSVQKLVPEQEKIYVGSTRHDVLCISDPLFYFLSGRASGTKHHWLFRGWANTKMIQNEIIGEIKKSGVNVVVLRKSLDCCGEPNASRDSSGIGDLDDYLRTNFETKERFGGNEILVRKK